MKLRRVALVALTAATFGTLAHAQQPTIQRIDPKMNNTVKLAQTSAALKIRPVQASAPLQSAIAAKKVFDPAVLKLSYIGDVPQLQLGASKKVTLEPVNQAAPQYVAVDPALRAQLTKYQPHYSARYVGKARLSPKVIEKQVDAKPWQTPIKDQGARGTCVAFASMAGLEQYYKKAYGISADLSENHAYNIFMSKIGSSCMADPGIRTVDAPNYINGSNLVCEESASGYVSSTSSSCSTIPAGCTSTRKHGITNAAKLFSPEFGGTGDELATNTSYLEALVNLGLPVVMGVYVAGSDWSDGSAESGIVDVQKNANGTPAGAYGGHAMLLVGYNATQDYVIFKNSWGTDRGHDGYFHLSYEYLQTYAKYGYVIVGVNDPR